MADFLGAIQAGIEAHNQSDAEKREIAAVFKELNAQIARVGNGQVSAGFKQKISTAATRLFDVMLSFSSPKGSVELARWQTTEGSYPVTLSFDGQDFTCHDRESLESILVQLLATAEAGKALAELADLPIRD